MQPIADPVDALRLFLTEVLVSLRERFVEPNDIQRLVEPTLDRGSMLLAVLFPEPTDGLKTPPKHLLLLYTYLRYANLPFLPLLENAKGSLPFSWPLHGIARVLTGGCDPVILTEVVHYIVRAIEPNANLDPSPEDIERLRAFSPRLCDSQWSPTLHSARHPAIPLIYLAIYLIAHRDTAFFLFKSEGLFDMLERLQISDFVDYERTADEDAATVESRRDMLNRLCVVLDRVSTEVVYAKASGSTTERSDLVGILGTKLLAPNQ